MKKHLCSCGKPLKCYFDKKGLIRKYAPKCVDCTIPRKRHGMWRTKVYRAWDGIKKRCLRKHCTAYPKYGGRGISICKSWMKFENFYKDMGDPPTLKHSIDRIDNNGNYEPSNCRWSTTKQQCNNKSNNTYITYNGETLTLKQWSEKINVSYETLVSRVVKYKWPLKKALTNKMFTGNNQYQATDW